MAQYADSHIFEFIRAKQESEQNEALRYLYKQQIGAMMFLGQSLGLQKEEAEEIFQDALFILYKQIRENDLKLSCKISTYLYSVVRRLSLKKLRDRKNKEFTGEINNRSGHELTENDSNQLNHGLLIFEESTLRRQKYSRVLAAMENELSNECKEILTAFYLEGLSLKEIWQYLNLTSLQVLKNKKSKCEKRLRKLMENEREQEQK